MKYALMVILVGILVSCTSDTSVQWIEGTFSDALQQAELENKPVLVDFYSPT